MDRNSDHAVKFMENPELRSFITRLIRNQVYDRIQSEVTPLRLYPESRNPVTRGRSLSSPFYQSDTDIPRQALAIALLG
jgi:hypothetical protein